MPVVVVGFAVVVVFVVVVAFVVVVDENVVVVTLVGFLVEAACVAAVDVAWVVGTGVVLAAVALGAFVAPSCSIDQT